MTTALQQIRAGLAEWFFEQMGEELPEVAIAPPGLGFDPPDGEWVRYSFQMTESFRDVLTGKRASGQRHTGAAVVQVFVPLGLGDGRAIEIADTIRAFMLERRIPVAGGWELFLTVPQVFIVGAESKYYHVNVRCEFDALEME